ncbi:unnamed protein product [Victoria cruziana]
MVRDFVENGSVGAESWCSSDSDSGLLDLAQCAKKIHSLRHSTDQSESDLFTTLRSLVLSIGETDLQYLKASPCNCSCIRSLLVKLFRVSGYDAGICIAKWEASGKVPGGDHEYIDIVSYGNGGSCERTIIDIDFRSHFEIARAVESYDAMLNALPMVYIGNISKLKQFLQVMVEAAKSSLKQNSMPFPPWRSLAYLQSKWQSAYERKLNVDDHKVCSSCLDHSQCVEHLKRMKTLLQSETEAERLFKPIINESTWRVKIDGRRRLVYGS